MMEMNCFRQMLAVQGWDGTKPATSFEEGDQGRYAGSLEERTRTETRRNAGKQKEGIKEKKCNPSTERVGDVTEGVIFWAIFFFCLSFFCLPFVSPASVFAVIDL